MTKEVKSVFSKEDLKRINDLIKDLEENIVKYKEEMTTPSNSELPSNI